MGSHEVCSAFASPTASACLPEQFTAVGVIFVVDSFLQNTAEMKRQPAQSKNQHEAEHRLRHFPPLHTQRQILMLPSASFLPSVNVHSCPFHVYLFHVVVERDAHAFFATKHLTGHESVEDSCAGQREAEIEAKQPPILHILVELEEQKRASQMKCNNKNSVTEVTNVSIEFILSKHIL